MAVRDLIVLDIMLPKVNGFEICRAVRAEKLQMPILMLTAKGQEEDIVRGLELGADDYITKPFSVRELLARAQAFLRRTQAGAAPCYTFGKCQLDTVSHRLLKDGVEVPLTNKEFRLLEYFLQHPGRAFTRDSIMNAVWGNSIDGDSAERGPVRHHASREDRARPASPDVYSYHSRNRVSV